MKVLQVYKTSIPVVAGGVDAVVHNLAFARGADYAAAVLRTAGWDEAEAAPRTVDGVQAFALHFPLPPARLLELRAWLHFLRKAPSCLWKLRTLLREQAIDLVHLHTLQHYQLYFVLARMLGGPAYVVTLHGSEVANFAARGIATRLAWRWVLSRAAAISAVSAPLKSAAENILDVKRAIDVLSNGVTMPHAPLPLRASVQARFALPPRYGVVVGALVDSKAQDTAIRAWSALSPAFDDIALVLVGEGMARETHRQLAREAGLAQRVVFTGQVDHPTTLAIMRDAQVMLVPSRREGFGLVVLEAGLLGVPLVLSSIEVFRHLVQDGIDGTICPVDDHAAFARAVETLLGDPALAGRLADTFRARVATEFDFSEVFKRYFAWYRTATAGARP